MDKSIRDSDMVDVEVEKAFDAYAEHYDAWYDSAMGKVLFASEVACLRPLLAMFPRPYLEVGTGTGRFGEAIGIEYGIDPSSREIQQARSRGVKVVLGRGENLPFPEGSFGGVLEAFTLCFVSRLGEVIREVRRVLVPGGGLVLGLLLKGTPWAESYAQRGAEGHPLYCLARFYSKEEIEDLLKENGFRVAAYRSTLFQIPGLEVYREETSVEGYVPGAGFVGLAAVRID